MVSKRLIADQPKREIGVKLEWHFLKRVSSLFLKGFSRKGVFHKKSFKVNLLSLFDPPPGSAIRVKLQFPTDQPFGLLPRSPSPAGTYLSVQCRLDLVLNVPISAFDTG
jgi:hypothetical protein